MGGKKKKKKRRTRKKMYEERKRSIEQMMREQRKRCIEQRRYIEQITKLENILPARTNDCRGLIDPTLKQASSSTVTTQDLPAVSQASTNKQDSSATVTSTSGGPESAPAPTEVKSTPAPTEVKSTPAPTEVKSTPAPTEVKSTPAPTEVKSTPAPTEVKSTPAPTQVTSTGAPTQVTSTGAPTQVTSTTAPARVIVDSKNAARVLSAQPDILSNTAPNLWHKVTVKTAVFDRMAVLSAINKRIFPLHLVPYCFRMENGHITFLVNSCSPTLTTLFRLNLTVPSPSTKIELKIQLHAKKVSISGLMERIISKRLSSEKTFLDLSRLISIPEFRVMLYDPSETAHLHQQLMKTAEVMAPNLFSLNLAGNELPTLRHFGSVFANRTKWRKLNVLDVSDNKIISLSELVVFNSVPIMELYLHKNPVCGSYKEANSYISVIRVHFPRLTKLDGAYLKHNVGLPQWKPNYIFCSKHGDSGELTDQFVEHFFTLYDCEDRTLLRGLYHENAYFSLCSMYLPGQSSSINARLTSYVAESRNILRLSDKGKMKAALYHGAEKILEKLEKLPRTQHDPYSFSVDLLYHSDISIVLTVTGVFKDRSQKQNISPRHFMRTFILVRLANDEYQIVNDILYVTNVTTREDEDSFRYTKPHKNVRKAPRWVTEGEKISMTQMCSQLTDMRTEWSRKCLDTAGWDLREALEIFIEMYEADKIPAEGFIEPKEAAK